MTKLTVAFRKFANAPKGGGAEFHVGRSIFSLSSLWVATAYKESTEPDKFPVVFPASLGHAFIPPHNTEEKGDLRDERR